MKAKLYRMNVHLEKKQREKLLKEKSKTGVPVATRIRLLIDEYLKKGEIMIQKCVKKDAPEFDFVEFLGVEELSDALFLMDMRKDVSVRIYSDRVTLKRFDRVDVFVIRFGYYITSRGEILSREDFHLIYKVKPFFGEKNHE